MGDSIEAYHDQRFHNDEWNPPQQKLSDKVKITLLSDKTLTEKQTKKLTAFYQELLKEDL